MVTEAVRVRAYELGDVYGYTGEGLPMSGDSIPPELPGIEMKLSMARPGYVVVDGVRNGFDESGLPIVFPRVKEMSDPSIPPVISPVYEPAMVYQPDPCVSGGVSVRPLV